MFVNILTSVVTMESYWVQLLSDFGDQQKLIENIVNIFKSVVSF
jgi:hypothetical protein